MRQFRLTRFLSYYKHIKLFRLSSSSRNVVHYFKRNTHLRSEPHARFRRNIHTSNYKSTESLFVKWLNLYGVQGALIASSSVVLTIAAIKSRSTDEKLEYEADRRDLLKAVDYFQAGNLDKCVYHLAIVAKRDEELQKVFYYLESDEFDKADELARKFFVDEHSLPFVYFFMKAIILVSLEQYQKAGDCFSQAFKHVHDESSRQLVTYHYNRLLNHMKKNNINTNNLPKLHRLTLKLFQIAQDWFLPKNSETKEKPKQQVSLEIYEALRELIVQYYPNINGQLDKKKIKGSKKVTIRVWERETGTPHSGHVSLQTPENYVSFWPGTKIGAVTFIDDILWYGRLPDYRISLYTLDINKMEAAIVEFKKSDCEWSEWGSLAGLNFLERLSLKKNSSNCSGVTYALLNSGGINRLAWYSTPALQSFAKDATLYFILPFLASMLFYSMGVSAFNDAQNVSYFAWLRMQFQNRGWRAPRPGDGGAMLIAQSKLEQELGDLNDAFKNYQEIAGGGEKAISFLGFAGTASYGAYVALCSFLRVFGYGAFVHPEHIKELAIRAQKYEREHYLRKPNNPLTMSFQLRVKGAAEDDTPSLGA